MRRVLVPLDGSPLAETILPDARRLAGPDGELVLVRDAWWTGLDSRDPEYSEWQAVEETERYLDDVTARLEAAGARTSAYRLAASDIAAGIDDTAALLDVDMMACATHGRSPLGRLLLGSIVWKALESSRLPILVRHAERSEPCDPESGATARRILVPLDGSTFAEAALPLARQLAAEWGAPLHLARVVPDRSVPHALLHTPSARRAETRTALADARAYLHQIAQSVAGRVRVSIYVGSPAARLHQAAIQLGITDVVMTTHTRAGLRRTIVGSVADELIQRLHCPMLLIPPRVVEASGSTQREVVLQRS